MEFNKLLKIIQNKQSRVSLDECSLFIHSFKTNGDYGECYRIDLIYPEDKGLTRPQVNALRQEAIAKLELHYNEVVAND